MFWSLSNNIHRAVINAKKYLRPYTLEDITTITSIGLADKAYCKQSDYSWELVRAYNTIRDDIGEQEQSLVCQELLYLYETGHAFKVNGVREMVEKLREHRNELETINTSTVNISLVYATQSATGQPNVFVANAGPVQTNAKVGRNIKEAFSQVPYHRIVRCTMDTLPEEVAGKVAVLNMLENNTFQEGVGFRIRSNLMYVFI
jgi:hypothetical protein